MDFNSNFEYDLEWGQLGENQVADMVEGNKTEVKSERGKWKQSGNTFVEFWCRGKASGIATTKAEYWSINLYYNDKFEANITVETEKLRKMVMVKDKYRRVCGGDDDTAKGFLVPIVDFFK
jgi:hypothetical protein|tara:strand:+ start:1304 stop:1666 length:363 start_codon:yes stop_codon:yes gene_type:complete